MKIVKKRFISIFVIWLFTISGIIGISIGYEDWFISLTPLNISIYLFLILWNSGFSKKLIFALLIPFLIGMVTEYLGVNYQLIFGNYQYGKNLGYKIGGVPWIIGINWAILTYCTAAITRKIYDHIIVSSLLGAIMMTALDVVLEIVAPRFDFWEFQGGAVPLQNYIGWVITAFVAQLLFQKVNKTYQFSVAIHIFIAILVFFTVFTFV